MKLSIAAAGVSFFGALAIGTAAAYVVGGGLSETEVVDLVKPPEVHVSYTLSPPPPPPIYRHAVVVAASDLLGTWTGTWGYDQERCMIVIKRVEGDRAYGTLYKDDAVISLAGEFDAEGQRLLLRETKVIEVSKHGEWSLGTNTGTFSAGGLTVSGTGIDKWGTYEWSVTKQ